MMAARARSLATFARSGSVIAASMGVMNVATYAYTLVAARLLGPQPYGAFAALMGLMLVVSVAQLGLQATAARRISATPGDVHQIESEVLRVGVRGALALGALLLVLAPVVNLALRLDSLLTAALVALTAVPLTMMGAQAGILQGERRWRPLGLIYLASGLPRLLIGTALVAWRPTEFAAMFAVAVTTFAPVLVGYLALRGSRRPTTDGASAPEAHTSGSLWRETLHNSHALLAFFALTNADVIVARNVLDAHDAGLYAGGAILIKVMLFLPQFIVVLAFPSMATDGARRQALTRSLAMVAALSVVAALGTLVLSGLAVVFIGGAQYEEIRGHLWLFTLLGGFASMMQLLVYNVLAAQARRAVLLLWGALVVVLLGAQLVNGYVGLVTLVLVVDATLFIILLVTGVRRLPPSAVEDETEVAMTSRTVD